MEWENREFDGISPHNQGSPKTYSQMQKAHTKIT